MSSFPSALAARLALGAAVVVMSTSAAWAAPAAAGPSAAVSAYADIGRRATPAEVQAWDIDVRPDFKGLPPGSGSVVQGQDIWEAKCASCHGVFGESNSVFSPLVGGTTAEDMKQGRVAHLNDSDFPGRTTLMKVPTVSTLWDYIRRAMPWNEPKSLTPDEVYAVTAFLLNLGNVVPADFTLSDRTIADAQARLPNRNGMTTDHGLWPGDGIGNGGKPDVRVTACMKDCPGSVEVRSSLPPHARNAHGNLAEQNRLVGAQLGADTTAAPGATLRSVASSTPAAPAPPKPRADPGTGAPMALLNQNQCLSCHALDRKVVGPALLDVAAKHQDRTDLVAYLATRIKQGGSGVWGPIPMPPQTISADDAGTIARWLATGTPKR